ncbi:ATP-dependent Clp protease [Chloropicon primus]|uniref:ATP-dependent Clp protease n=1 Tax=Chloropicon primus TaxID=1764295 RepID=A0A5B8MKR2_9CHLO|nr:ATP-dependent Clp protease [Chloropicon primus]UPQ99191.1 ATP-dependent Clp protease [Chloropicon primus]|mmetsp:Transcript_12109/g.33549  ORF Transcript_12109/g.33549 Transcript_12109/m.33549 type:complete len:946 (-) Transcript_12109:60-2897(-)|eukprot:QDZ19980.1 ATP-dependent Clp protease [Chloropicon primus]
MMMNGSSRVVRATTTSRASLRSAQATSRRAPARTELRPRKGTGHAFLLGSPVVGAPAPRRGLPGGSSATRSVARMVFERFTERAIKAVMAAQNEARAMGRPEVTTDELLLGLIVEDSAARTAKNRSGGFVNTGITIHRAREVVKTLRGSGNLGKGLADIPFSLSAKEIFDLALEKSKEMGHNFVAPEHITVALVSAENSTINVVIRKLSVEPETVVSESIKQLNGQTASEGWKKPVTQGSGGQGQQQQKSVLEEFCRDLCEEARDGYLDPVIGRDKEILRVMQILARRRKNNPILLGEPGVGKTAIAEGLAQCIVNDVGVLGEELPEFLKDKKIMSLDVGLLMAGAKERGELENRVTKLLQEITESRKIILLVDEVHTLVGAGSVGRGGGGGGGLDISNLMKPALARGDLQCIGATTLDEHRKYIERDAALERRFQPVTVDEPTEEDAYEIIKGLQERYERYHQCIFTNEAIQAAVTLASRYIADRYLPDKAIDLIDEAGSRSRIASFDKRRAQDDDKAEENDALWEQYQQVTEAKDACIKGQTFEEAALLQQRETELKTLMMDSGNEENDGFLSVVDRDAIEEIITQWTGVPLRQLQDADKSRMLELKDSLAQRVIGQKEAVEAIAKAMQRASVGLKNPNRPIATMLFSGPTGVGKTELAKSLAFESFGSKDSMIRLDMSEYMEKHTVAKLVGSPPGYVGYGEGGKLTEAVRRKPYSLILLDEVEKAHPDVFNILLQVIEDGILTDSQGRTVSFKNCILILTSNLGSNVIAKGGTKLGFALPTESAEETQYNQIRGLVLEELRAYFKPELLNRLDEVVVFRLLEQKEIAQIADLLLDETAGRMAEKGIGFEVTRSMMDKLVTEGFDRMYGARPLRRTIMSLIEDYLADALMKNELQEGDIARMDVDENGDVCVTRCIPGEVCIAEEEPEIAYAYEIVDDETANV